MWLCADGSQPETQPQRRRRALFFFIGAHCSAMSNVVVVFGQLPRHLLPPRPSRLLREPLGWLSDALSFEAVQIRDQRLVR